MLQIFSVPSVQAGRMLLITGLAFNFLVATAFIFLAASAAPTPHQTRSHRWPRCPARPRSGLRWSAFFLCSGNGAPFTHDAHTAASAASLRWASSPCTMMAMPPGCSSSSNCTALRTCVCTAKMVLLIQHRPDYQAAAGCVCGNRRGAGLIGLDAAPPEHGSQQIAVRQVFRQCFPFGQQHQQMGCLHGFGQAECGGQLC